PPPAPRTYPSARSPGTSRPSRRRIRRSGTGRRSVLSPLFLLASGGGGRGRALAVLPAGPTRPPRPTTPPPPDRRAEQRTEQEAAAGGVEELEGIFREGGIGEQRAHRALAGLEAIRDDAKVRHGDAEVRGRLPEASVRVVLEHAAQHALPAREPVGYVPEI